MRKEKESQFSKVEKCTDITKSGESVLEVRERERERAELTRHLLRKRRQSLSNVTRSFGLFALLRKRETEKAFTYQVAVLSLLYHRKSLFHHQKRLQKNSKLVSEFHDT